MTDEAAGKAGRERAKELASNGGPNDGSANVTVSSAAPKSRTKLRSVRIPMESGLPARTSSAARPEDVMRAAKGQRDRDRQAKVIHDWNLAYPVPLPGQPFELNDETLRDGVQSPSVSNPSLEDKLELLVLMQSI